MALSFPEERERKKYFNWVLLIVILIALLWFGRGFLMKPPPPPPSPPKKKTVEINLQLLDNPVIQELQVFEEIPPFEGETGRENPFLPHSK